MRILQIFNLYLEKGGEEASVHRIAKDLRSEHSIRQLYFSSTDMAPFGGIRGSLRQASLMLYNPKSIRKFKQAVSEFKPELILVHNLMPVGSAALFFELLKTRIPVIHYIHNFRPFSVNGYCWAGNKLAPEGLHLNFLPEIIGRSWQNSAIKTTFYAAIILFLHLTGVYRRINGWIAISNFMRDSFVTGGIDPCKITVLPHAWDIAPETPEKALPATRLLFLGRLTEAKGLIPLLDAWQQLEETTAEGELVIGGDGPLADWVKQRCSKLKRARYVGFVGRTEKAALIRDSLAMVIPSVWWEPLGLVVYEAYDMRRPVIASSSGGLSESVMDGQTGWLCPPSDVNALASAMRHAITHPMECIEMGQRGRGWLESHTGKAVWLDRFNQFANAVVAQDKASTLDAADKSSEKQ